MSLLTLAISAALLTADPEAGAAARRADEALAKGDFDTAVLHLDDAIRRDPSDYLNYAKRASAHFYKQRYEKAVDDFTEGLRLQPRDDRMLADRGLCRWKLAQFAQSADDFRKALNLNSDNVQAIGGLAWALAVSPKDELRDGKKALELATKACELTDWKDYYHLSTLAAAHAELGNFDEALRRHREAMAASNFPKDKPERAQQRLKLYEQRKPYRDAIEK